MMNKTITIVTTRIIHQLLRYLHVCMDTTHQIVPYHAGNMDIHGAWRCFYGGPNPNQIFYLLLCCWESEIH